MPLYMGGAKLVRSLAAGPCMDNIGLFHPVTGYNGKISVSFLACREMMPDPEFYEQCLRESFEELCAAVPARPVKKKVVAKAKAKARPVRKKTVAKGEARVN